MSEGVPAYNTLRGQQRALDNAGRIPDPPENCSFADEEQRQFWSELTRSRAFDTWHPAAIAIAWKVLQLEFLIRRGHETLKNMIADGADPFHPDSIASEVLDRIAKFERHQLSQIRALGLTFTAVQSKSAGNSVAAQKRAEEALGIIGAKVTLPSMLATN